MNTQRGKYCRDNLHDPQCGLLYIVDYHLLIVGRYGHVLPTVPVHVPELNRQIEFIRSQINTS